MTAGPCETWYDHWHCYGAGYENGKPTYYTATIDKMITATTRRQVLGELKAVLTLALVEIESELETSEPAPER